MISDIIEARDEKYGNFADQSVISQEIQNAIVKGYLMRGDGQSLGDIPAYMLEVLTMLSTKISRIVNGDPYYKDNWVDIAGYAQLVVNQLEKEEEQNATKELQESGEQASIQYTGGGTAVPDSARTRTRIPVRSGE